MKKNKLNVLIVEDDQDIRGSIEKMASRFFNVTIAVDGQEGYEKLLENQKLAPEEHFQVVLTDINMPRMNGFQLIEKTRELNQQPKIFIMSGYETNESLSVQYPEVVHYFRKPFSFKEVLDKIIDNTKDVNF